MNGLSNPTEVAKGSPLPEPPNPGGVWTFNPVEAAKAPTLPDFTDPKGAWTYCPLPEFTDHKGLRAGFGISRAHGYDLAARGLVKTVVLRRPGATRGKRLWVCESVRAYLLANIDEPKAEDSDEAGAADLTTTTGSDTGETAGAKSNPQND